ncbi:hypothetical protein VIGAN_04358100, partial [Vigna angularis var. angularis]
MTGRKGRRLLLIPLPVQGHINPMLQLAEILHSKGFSITIIHTTFNSPDPSNYPHFTFSFFQDGLSQTQPSDLLNFLVELNVKCVHPFKDCVTKLLRTDQAAEEPVACLISDAICYFTQAVADNLQLPRIVLRTSGISSYVAFLAYPLFRQRGYIPTQGSLLSHFSFHFCLSKNHFL